MPLYISNQKTRLKHVAIACVIRRNTKLVFHEHNNTAVGKKEVLRKNKVFIIKRKITNVYVTPISSSGNQFDNLKNNISILFGIFHTFIHNLIGLVLLYTHSVHVTQSTIDSMRTFLKM